MLALLWTALVRTLAWVPLRLVAGFRRWGMGRRGLVKLSLGGQPARGVSPAFGTVQTLAALRSIGRDDAVRAVVVELKGPGMGWASAMALRRAIDELRERGKLVITHLDGVTLRELYITSVMDRVWMSPCSEVYLSGVGARLAFYGEALKNLGLKVDLEAAGTFKSFGEPYTRSFASAANRIQMNELVGDLQDILMDGICSGRRIASEDLQALLSRGPLSAEQAVEVGLIDGVAYPDQVKEHLEELLGGKLGSVSFGRYAFWYRIERWLSRCGQRPVPVAVVHLEGPVVQGAGLVGRGSDRRIDSDRVVPVLDRLAKSPEIEGVVLNVDSPGGSAVASDLIGRSVRRLMEQKPVVAVFGNVSASGGYYLSAAATEIIAEANTLTGSIGVVGGKLVFGPALAQVGVHTETVAAGPDTGMLSPWEGFTPDQRQRFRVSLQRVYDRFVAVVAAGRRRPARAIEEVAQGRVWTGRQALERGLVDQLGGFERALERVRELADLEPGSGGELHIRFEEPRFKALLNLLGRGSVVRTRLIPELLGMMGIAGLVLHLVHKHPMQGLTVLPWDID